MNKYRVFKAELLKLKSSNKIEIYYRGLNAKNAFGVFNLELKDYKIRSFAEKLFYFGQKSEYFWENDVQNKIPLNKINETVFAYIFKKYNKLKNTKNPTTRNFIKENENQFEFYFNNKNKEEFIENCLNQELFDIKKTRDYLFIILHRIGNLTTYKNKSHFISTTSSIDISEKFAKGGLIITFWDPYKWQLDYNSIYKFDSIIYPEQKENTVFSGIFPQYILSFTYKGMEYFNPYIDKCAEIEHCILGGFDIDQSNFIEKLYKETNFEFGVQTNNHIDYFEIK